jgi:predicted transcriptional regulator
MSDTERVRAWRERLKQEGRVPMTIWVTAETKARYEDLALTYHRSPSELAQQALDAYRPDQAAVTDTITDAERLRAFIRTEMAQFTSDVTATITAAVTDTLMAQLQELVQAAVSAGVSATVTDTEAVTGPVTAAATDTEAVTPPGGMGSRPFTAPTTATATDTETVTRPRSVAAPRVTATATATRTETPASAYDADAAFARMQALQAQGLTLAQIAAQLTAEGWRTRHGKPWHKSTVAYVLKTHGR